MRAQISMQDNAGGLKVEDLNKPGIFIVHLSASESVLIIIRIPLRNDYLQGSTFNVQRSASNKTQVRVPHIACIANI